MRTVKYEPCDTTKRSELDFAAFLFLVDIAHSLAIIAEYCQVKCEGELDETL